MTARQGTHGGGGRASAVAVLVTAWGLAATALVLMVLADAPWDATQWYFVVDTADALVYGLVAAVVLSRRTHPVAWLVALTAVGGGVAAVTAQAVALWARDRDAGALPPSWSVLQGTAWVPGTLALLLVVPHLLSERAPSRASRAAIAAGVVLIAGLLAVRLTDPWPWPAAEPYAPLAVRHTGWARWAEPAQRILLGCVVALGLVAAAHAVRRRMRDPAGRGLGWLAIGTALVALTFLPLVLFAGEGPAALRLFTPLTHLASQAFFPAAVLVVVLGGRLWGIDLVVSRALVWWLLTGLLVAGYLCTVAVLGLLLPGDGTPGRVLATAVPAAVVQPARSWLQRRVDRLVHGEAAAPALGKVGRHLGSAAGPEQALTGMAESIAASFNLGSVRIVDEDGTTRVAVGAPAGAEAVVVPLVVRRRTAGRMLVTARPGERLDRRARSALDEVAPVVATTVHLAAVTRELRESRGRLAAARDDERRALRRELHDQLGPALAGIGLGLAAARNLLPDDSPAGPLLGRLRHEVDARVEEVRVLARGLFPPVLTELGLMPALRELAMRHEADGLTVVVRTDRTPAAGEDGPEPPREVSGTVYAVVAEALRNVVRHAGARTCAVTVENREPELLLVTVVDDGRGIGPGSRDGVGTQSLRERAEALGGTIGWEPGEDGHGTRVVLRLPLRPGGTPREGRGRTGAPAGGGRA
ncbi:sensor histidine kinase [Streptomyces sp. TRM S81-3]|uniref:Oxygen sensor histidine kinase NreB n=1 Tax=Streptomyces griseicoloratus TaxID=2752516 RepID=A0A926KWM1_9ACTN|nr:ATP-binding protein [Streptomyces griseicoloratus]MBD0418185.1 sensor histidine kinase [Streptomyces griseicoloratus]